MSEWKRNRLGEYVKLKGGFAFKSSDFLEAGDVPVLRISNIKPSGIELENAVYITKELGNECKGYYVETGNVVIAMSGATTGKATVIKEKDLPLILNQRVGLFSIIDEGHLYEPYLAQVVQSKEFLSDIGVNAIGGAQPNISGKQIEDIVVDIPPIQEQRKIASILSTVDEAIEKTEAIIGQTEKVKKGLMQQLLTKGIGHSKFKKTEVGEIPVEWEVKTFKDLLQEGTIIDIQDGNHGNAHPKASDYVSQGIPFIMANNLMNGKIDLINCKFLNREQTDKLRIGFAVEGDILLTHKGTIGRTAIVPRVESYVMLTPQVTYYRVNARRLLNKFLRYFFESNYFQNRLEKLSAQSTRSYIGITNQKSLLMVIPTLEEQEEIVKALEIIDEKIVNESSMLEQLQILKKGLMQNLLTGKVRVNIDEDEVKQV